MIIGVTHSESGELLVRRAVTTKVAIGRGPSNGKNYPSKLDHFILLKKTEKDGAAGWTDDTDKMQFYGEKPTELVIVLLDDKVDEVFRTQMAWWTKTQRNCWGDGERATRRTKEHPDGQDWEPCANHGCPQLESGECKPSADLFFMLADFPSLGSICRLHTSSYQSIREIYSALTDLKNMMGGRLLGLPVKLFVRPEKATFEDAQGQKKTSKKYILGLELRGESLPAMLEDVSRNAKVFADLRQVMNGKRLQIEEDENELAPEISEEFVSIKGALPPAADMGHPTSPDLQAKIESFHKAAEVKGMNAAARHMLLGKHEGNIEAAMKELENLTAQPEPTSARNPSQDNTAKSGKKGRKITAPESVVTAPVPEEPKQEPAAPAEPQGSWNF